MSVWFAVLAFLVIFLKYFFTFLGCAYPVYDVYNKCTLINK